MMKSALRRGQMLLAKRRAQRRRNSAGQGWMMDQHAGFVDQPHRFAANGLAERSVLSFQFPVFSFSVFSFQFSYPAYDMAYKKTTGLWCCKN